MVPTPNVLFHLSLPGSNVHFLNFYIIHNIAPTVNAPAVNHPPEGFYD